MRTLPRILLAFLVVVSMAHGLAGGGGDGSYRPILHALVSAGLFALVLAVERFCRELSAAAGRAARTALCCLFLPVVFSAMGWLLPAVHPEPFEWTFAWLDARILGDRAAFAHLPWPLVDLLQITYASFYAIPIAAAVLAGRKSGARAFDRSMVILTFGFLASYLGYLLVPTLGPAVALPGLEGPRGSWLAARLHEWIDAAEANRWDCFPSGHTMMSLMSLHVVRRWARAFTVPFAVVVGILIASTILLRYHWVADVLAGAALAPICMRIADRMLDADGVPRVGEERI
ncbi:MAG: hypothetical protein Fur0037_13220 [Planctomycetota bacterium]